MADNKLVQTVLAPSEYENLKAKCANGKKIKVKFSGDAYRTTLWVENDVLYSQDPQNGKREVMPLGDGFEAHTPKGLLIKNLMKLEFSKDDAVRLAFKLLPIWEKALECEDKEERQDRANTILAIALMMREGNVKIVVNTASAKAK